MLFIFMKNQIVRLQTEVQQVVIGTQLIKNMVNGEKENAINEILATLLLMKMETAQ